MEIKCPNTIKNIISKVKANSIASDLGMEKGDELISVNGKKVKDIIEYKYLITEEFLIIGILKKSGELIEYEIEKDYDEDLGIEFINPLIDKVKSCANRCIFCFIDQLPKGLRKTLYIKDDDNRLSFLQGNFITLTNLSEDEIQRIIKYRISPVNISVHTVNPDLRIRMLNNPKASEIMNILKRFKNAGIEMNIQIVAIPRINDGEELKRTALELFELYPQVKSVAVVPVGLTKFRKHLYPLRGYTKDEAKDLLNMIFKMQEGFLSAGTRFIFPSDEFFVLAEENLPGGEYYEGYPQFENGVGLMTSFYEETLEYLNDINFINLNESVLFATGSCAFKYMKNLVNKVSEKIHFKNYEVREIKNDFFGRSITVAGLLTAGDICGQLTDVGGFDKIILPKAMFNTDMITLDDFSVEDLERKLRRKVILMDNTGISWGVLGVDDE